MAYWMTNCVDCRTEILLPRGTEAGKTRCYKCKSEHKIRMARTKLILEERREYLKMLSAKLAQGDY